MVLTKYSCCEGEISYHVLRTVPDTTAVSVVWLSLLLPPFFSYEKSEGQIEMNDSDWLVVAFPYELLHQLSFGTFPPPYPWT